MINNQYELTVGDIITGYNTGIHEITKMEEIEGDIEVTYNQVYSMDGRPVAMNRPAVCSIKYCKPAILEIPKTKERIKGLFQLLTFLEKQAKLQ